MSQLYDDVVYNNLQELINYRMPALYYNIQFIQTVIIYEFKCASGIPRHTFVNNKNLFVVVTFQLMVQLFDCFDIFISSLSYFKYGFTTYKQRDNNPFAMGDGN